MNRKPGQVIAGCFALSAFIIALVAGLSSGNPSSTILFRALLALLLCYPLGSIIGILCERVVSEQVQLQRGLIAGNPAAAGASPGSAPTSGNQEEVMTV